MSASYLSLLHTYSPDVAPLFRHESTGGGCDAFVADDFAGFSSVWITEEGDPSTPDTADAVVFIGCYAGDRREGEGEGEDTFAGGLFAEGVAEVANVLGMLAEGRPLVAIAEGMHLTLAISRFTDHSESVLTWAAIKANIDA